MAKTADEMFRELGYKESEFEDIYINDKEIRICVSNRTEIAKWTYDKFGETVWIAFTPEEILACAKLIKESADYISDCKTVDAVPVVRCRECDMWNEWDHSGHKEYGNYVCSCAYWSGEDGVVHYTRPDDFCSYGERKDV